MTPVTVRSCHELVDMVWDDPAAVEALATAAVVSSETSDDERLHALWARGLALRERGDLGAAEGDLCDALVIADHLGLRSVVARIAVTLSLTLQYSGRGREAAELLERAELESTGADLGHVYLQRAIVMQRNGDLEGALRGYGLARDVFDRFDERFALARVLNNLGVLYAFRGAHDLSIEHSETASRLAESLGQQRLAAQAQHNLGYSLARTGDLARALHEMEAAERRFAAMPNSDGALAVVRADRADVLLQANLAGEARQEAELALVTVEASGNVTELADMLLLVARCRLADGDQDDARQAADEAAVLFSRHERLRLLPLAELVGVRADLAGGVGDGDQVAERAMSVAASLDEVGWRSEATTAWVVAGMLLLESGQTAAAVRLHRRVLRAQSGAAGDRAAVSLFAASLHERTGDRSAARRCVNRGLRTLADNQASLGALELRAHAISHGHSLAEIGARLAVQDHRPRELLGRIEAARGMISLLPRAVPPDDDVLADLLSDLRSTVEEIRLLTSTGTATHHQSHRRLELEQRIRSHTRTARASGAATELQLGEAVGALGERQLVEYANLDGILWAVTADRGRCAMHELGSIDEIEVEVDQIDFALNRLNRVQGSPASREAARETIRHVGGRLGQQLLPDRVRSTERPLVIVPTGRLHGLAWRALPLLAGRAVTVSPSLFGHTIATRGAASDRRRHSVLVAGPDLPAAPEELRVLSAIYPTATVLDVATSDAASCLAAFSTATLAHVACHGSFRSDNPLFSTLRVADGDLTVYDLERCERLPHTMVLSACNAAASSVLRGGALLGMSSSLIQFGVSSVVAPLTPVSDERSVALMTRLHRELAAGLEPAAALARAALVDGELDATASAFVVIGA